MKSFLSAVLTLLFLASSALAETQYLSYSFGRVPVSSREAVDYYLSNTDAKQDLKVLHITIDGIYFDADSDCPSVLKPGEKCFTRIYYWPGTEGMHYGHVVWETSDGVIDLTLWGEAYRF